MMQERMVAEDKDDARKDGVVETSSAATPQLRLLKLLLLVGLNCLVVLIRADS
jgi:hypothetical protein